MARASADDYERAAKRAAGNPFLFQHLREVAIDHQNGIFAGTNDNVEKIGVRPPMTLEVLTDHCREGGTISMLFLTAREAVCDRVRGLDSGADAYLCKPFTFDELLARALIRRGRRVEVTKIR